MLIEAFACVGACVVGYGTARAAIMLWRGDIQVQVRRKSEPDTAPQPVPSLTDDEFAVIHAWAQMNPWYRENAVLNLEAQSIHTALKTLEPHLSLRANLAEVTAEMHRRHPEIVPTRQ